MTMKQELVLLRQELTRFQAKLSLLESQVSLEKSDSHPLPSINTAQSINNRPSNSQVSKHKVLGRNTKRDSQTLRSRSFQVMRHLINLVDVSQADVASPKPKTARQPTSLLPTARSERSVTSATNKVTKGSASISSRLKALNDHEEAARAHSPGSVTFRPPKPGVAQEPSKARSFRPDIPRVFHPKRPRKDIPTSSELLRVDDTITDLGLREQEVMKGNNLNAATLHRQTTEVEPINNEKTTPCPDHMPSTVVAKTIPQPVNKDPPEKTTTIVFQSDCLKRNSDRLDLLKLDPAFSDLLPSSGSDYVCFKTRYWTPINNIPRASPSLIQQQTLGVWEWKEGTSTAKLYEYRVPTSEKTIDRRRFKYIGWAWRGKMDQQPPRIEDLPEDIHQGCDTLRWYWFKDLWLLFYFD